MSFSHYKIFLRWTQISSRNMCNPEVLRKLYSNNVIFSSPSPHEFKFTSKNKSSKFKKSPSSKRLKQIASFEEVDDFNDQDLNEDMQEYKEQTDKLNLPKKKSCKQPKINFKLMSDPKYQQPSKDYNKEKEKLDYHSNISTFKSLSIQDDCKQDSRNEKFNESASENSSYIFSEDENLNCNSNIGKPVTLRSKILNTTLGEIRLDLSTDEFDMSKYIKDLIHTKPLEPLDECKEDISDFGPGLSPTFNFAAYADKSPLIQEYVKLGVKLYKVEKNLNHMRALMTVDLKTELPVYLQFLHDCGVPADSLGDVITENPMLLKEDLDDLKTRIRYLRAHEFDVESVARIVTKNPTWLTWATKHIDERLGHFQNEFKLDGPELRFLATKQPKLITYKFKHIHENTFAVREEMGFRNAEIKVLLLSKPRLWMNSRKKIVDAFNYLHNTMKLSHLTIASQADVLTCRKSRIANRHEFLVELKRDQYDPQKPGYIAPKTIVYGNDEEFCRDVAKAALDTYNLFLKTR